jgi:hypothetical protein
MTTVRTGLFGVGPAPLRKGALAASWRAFRLWNCCGLHDRTPASARRRYRPGATYERERKIRTALTRRLMSDSSASASFEKIALMCFSTARMLRESEAAIAGLLLP